ncbi:hypothetical protein [Alloacidobacterium sp.]|uniref:hypothetical protein n=1 Tax=Alloacidobacterium sp. TaxID=2951999 RepID=UPI002D34455D|nr:hypothetical protein [Alloacidobacterium sp.]HYK36883.1 hypothetical protein [Alloacidobacterium sp.]
MSRPRVVLLFLVVAAIIVFGLIWSLRRSRAKAVAVAAPVSAEATVTREGDDLTPTMLYAHNIRLRKGPNFCIYIRWIRGQMVRTNPQITPSFDDPDSFVLDIQKGVINANIGDIANYLNASAPPDAPLKKISIEPDGDQIRLRGTVHKIFSIPVELKGTLTYTQDGFVEFHAAKINVLKIPLKGLLGGFHIALSDLVRSTNIPGIVVAGNDIIFDTTRVLPPPHIRGQLTAVKVKPPDIVVVYGNAPDNDAQLAKWHNFLRLNGGTIGFGKLIMRYADLTMIDASHDSWFDLDLVNYQAQLVRGYTRMTSQAGLEIFMPDVDESAPAKAAKSVTLEWLRDCNRALPPDVPAGK